MTSFIGDPNALMNRRRHPSFVPALSRRYVALMTTSRILILVGIAVVLIGLLWPWLSKLGLGRLPGDIVVQRQGFSFYFPIVTCLIISVVASLLFWLFRR
jgi:hypothetical protein